MDNLTGISRLLFIRVDRLGDLVLTLPVDENFKSRGQDVTWWIPKGLSFVTSHAHPVRKSKEIEKKIKITDFFKLLSELKLERYDAAVIFHGPWWLSLLIWLARIPIRAGVKSQWHSFLFLNRAIRQKRSRAEHSELEYGYRLVEEAFGLSIGSLVRTSLLLKSSSPELLINKYKLVRGGYSVVHPGMGGSALNWPTEKYEEFIRALVRTEDVVITGTSADEPYLSPLREALRGESRVLWLDGKLKGDELLSILAGARTVTAPSTGVLHLAASLGRPTLGIFSPVRVQKPQRWGPQGLRASYLVPNVKCPGEMNCHGPECPYFNCMQKIASVQAAEKLSQLVEIK